MKRASDLSRVTLEKIVDQLQQFLFLTQEQEHGRMVFDPAKDISDQLNSDLSLLLESSCPDLIPSKIKRFSPLKSTSEACTVVIKVKDSEVQQVTSDGNLRVLVVNQDIPPAVLLSGRGLAKVDDVFCRLSSVENVEVDGKSVHQALGDMLVSEHLSRREAV